MRRSTLLKLILAVAMLLALFGSGAGLLAAPPLQGAGLFLATARQPTLPGITGPLNARSAAVTINWGHLGFDPARGSQSRLNRTLNLNLFPDIQFTAVQDRIELTSSRLGLIWIGHLEGIPNSFVTLVAEKSVLVGKVALPGAIYLVRPAGLDIHLVSLVNLRALPPESTEPGKGPLTPGPAPARPVSTTDDDGSLIDVLVVYTQDVTTAYGSQTAVNAMIDAAITEANTTYSNSGIIQRARLMYRGQVAYTESGNSGTDVGRLEAGTNGLNVAHTLRDQYHADIVFLIVANLDFCGQAAMIMDPVSRTQESHAYAVVEDGCTQTNLSLPHEGGHLMSARHDWATDGTNNSPYTYNHGYIEPGNTWRTVMAYPGPCSSCPRLPYWSNPDVTYGGIAMGIAEGNANAADNRKTLNNTHIEVANFRTSASSELAMSKTAPASVTAGTSLSYAIAVTNNGPDGALDLVFTDNVPTGTTFASFTAPAGWACTTPAVGGTGTVNCTAASLANGASANFALVVNVPASAANGSTISNTATVSSVFTDPNTGNNASTANTTVATSADLGVTKTDSPDPVVAGTNLTYSIGLTNNGPSDAQTAQWSEPLPANTTFVSLAQNTGPSFSCTTPAVGAGGTVTCTRSTFALSAAATFTLVVKVSPSAPNGSTLSNTATVTSATTDPTPGNNSATATTAVIAQADLSVSKTKSTTGYAGAGTLTYNITLVNNGPSDAQNVLISDALDPTTPLSSATASNGGLCTGTTTVTCTWTTVPAGATYTVTIVTNMNPDAWKLTNTVAAATTTTDPNAANNTFTIPQFTVPTKADMKVLMTARVIAPGRAVIWDIQVINGGPSVARSASLSDTLDGATRYLNVFTSGIGTCMGGMTVNCTFGDLWPGAMPPGQAPMVRIQAMIIRSVTSIPNSVKVGSTTFDDVLSNNKATLTVPIGGGGGSLSRSLPARPDSSFGLDLPALARLRQEAAPAF